MTESANAPQPPAQPSAKPSRERPPSPARERVARSITHACKHFPDLGPVELDTSNLDPRDAGLALSLHRTILQRWLTLEHLLVPALRKPMAKVEPIVRAALLLGAAQIVFFDRTPRRVAVDESVRAVAALGRPQAKGLVNAVLRKLSDRVGTEQLAEPWTPAANRLPIDQGTIALNGNFLPKVDNMVAHLAVATSHPLPLIARWQKAVGNEAALAMALHNVMVPPTIVSVESGFNILEPSEHWQAHTLPGHILWQGDHEALVAFLEADPARRVQDVTSALPVAEIVQRVKKPRVILDYCAGVGTKTRQLAAAYPNARIIATDTDTERLYELASSMANTPNVAVMPMAALSRHLSEGEADLLLLDVPCSNTGVLARRPEARYRFSDAGLASLIELQRTIIRSAIRYASPECILLYSTCSIEPEENQQQLTWLREAPGFELIAEHQTLPSGSGPTYQDGGYYALTARFAMA